jgi:prevent-host-death family protein
VDGSAVNWQVQEAKQRFSELLRIAHVQGPQVVTRHGEAVAVVIDISEYRHLTEKTTELKDYLRAGPVFDDLDLARPAGGPRATDWTDAPVQP